MQKEVIINIFKLYPSIQNIGVNFQDDGYPLYLNDLNGINTSSSLIAHLPLIEKDKAFLIEANVSEKELREILITLEKNFTPEMKYRERVYFFFTKEGNFFERAL